MEALRASLRAAPTLEAAEAIQAEIAALEGKQGLVEGNGKHHPPTDDLAIAMRQVRDGADFYAVVLGLAPTILSGNLAEPVARATLVAAYAKPDGDDLFSAAMLEAASAPVEVPRLSHKNPLKSADAFIELCHRENGVRLLHRFEGDYYRWVGTHYAVLDEPILRGQVWRFLPKGNLTPNSAKVSNVLDAVDSEVHLPGDLVPPAWLGEKDADYPEPSGMVALRSGLLDPATGALYPATPRLFHRFCLPFEYDPADAAPPEEWLRFLSSVWGDDAEKNGFPNDPESIDCLQEMMGYLLTPDLSMEKMFLTIGPPRSGKGTIARVIEGLLGRENIASSSLGTLSTDHGTQNLVGKSALLIPDAMVSGKTDIIRAVEELKKISGQDAVTVNPKNRPVFSTHLRLHVLVFANELPRFADASNALSSRFIILRMTRSFLGDEDMGLKARLIPELPRILHWALQGRRRLYKRGHFLMPESASELMTELEEQSSPVRAFIRDKCEEDAAGEVAVPRLWTVWKAWCEENGRDSGTMQWFGRDIRAALPRLVVRNKRTGEKRVRTYIGLRERDILP